MIKKPLSLSQVKAGLDPPAFRVVEVMRLFAKDSIGVRIAVLCGLLGAEIALRALVALARLGMVFALVYASAHWLC
jgi:hypothetical protein